MISRCFERVLNWHRSSRSNRGLRWNRIGVLASISVGLGVCLQTAIADEAAHAPASDAGKERGIAEAVVTRPADNQVVDQPWGRITWYVSGALKNSDTMTVGQALIRPGKENPRHFHPNCDEVLHVLKGRILQTIGDKTVEMRVGDTVSIPMGMKHNAKNIGSEDAVLAISFSSADRQVVGE